MSGSGPDLRPLLAAALLVGLGALAYWATLGSKPPPTPTPTPSARAQPSAKPSRAQAPTPPPLPSAAATPSRPPATTAAATPTPATTPASAATSTPFVLEGRVVDTDGPVPGARVTLWYASTQPSSAKPQLGIEREEEALALARIGGAVHDLGQGRTDDAGRYRVPIALPQGPLNLRVSAHAAGEGGAPARVASTLVRVSAASRAKGSGDAGDLKLAKVPALRFHVRGPAGAPQEGARIVVYRELTPPGWSAPHPQPWVRVLKTDAEGWAGLDLRGTRVAFSVTHPGHATDHGLADLSSKGLAVEVQLEAGVSLEGQVVDAEGNPLAGVLLQAHEEGANLPSEALANARLSTQAKSDAEGRFRLEGLGAKRSYTLVATSPDLAILPLRQSVRAPAEALSLTLQRGQELIAEGACAQGRPAQVGFVLQQRGQEGWKDAGLHAPQPEQPFRAHFGRLAPGTYRVALHGVGYAPVVSEPQTLDGTGAPPTLRLRLDAPPRSLRGQVLDERGSPLPGATIQWTDFGTIYAQSDAEGRFLLEGLPTGALQVVVGLGGYAPQPVQASAGVETLPAVRLRKLR